MLQSSSLPRFGTTIAQGTNVIDSEWWELSAILDLMMFDLRTADMQVQNSLQRSAPLLSYLHETPVCVFGPGVTNDRHSGLWALRSDTTFSIVNPSGRMYCC